MAKHLTITYGDAVLYDDTPEHLSWTETDGGGISIKAGPKPEPKRMPPELAELVQRGLQQAKARAGGA